MFQQIEDAFTKQAEVFVFLRYVVLRNPCSDYPALIVSWMNASTLRVDPDISYVQEMKQSMLRSF